MVSIDITAELVFKTSRSGGSGGQNVNKVETQVEARWAIYRSVIVTEEQKAILVEKLKNKINIDQELVVKSSEDRTQLGNKQIVIQKINTLVNKALLQPKRRKKTHMPKAVKEKIKRKKILQKEKKEGRRKVKVD